MKATKPDRALAVLEAFVAWGPNKARAGDSRPEFLRDNPVDLVDRVQTATDAIWRAARYSFDATNDPSLYGPAYFLSRIVDDFIERQNTRADGQTKAMKATRESGMTGQTTHPKRHVDAEAFFLYEALRDILEAWYGQLWDPRVVDLDRGTVLQNGIAAVDRYLAFTGILDVAENYPNDSPATLRVRQLLQACSDDIEEARGHVREGDQRGVKAAREERADDKQR